MNLQCHACGMKFRSMNAEAKHRHNFPVLCNRDSKAWRAFQKELEEKRNEPSKSDPRPG